MRGTLRCFVKRRIWSLILNEERGNPKHKNYQGNFRLENVTIYATIQTSMNENPLTHNPLNQGGADNRRKTWMTTAVIVLAVITLAGIAYSVYAWQQNQKLSADVTTKNNQIADLQKQANTPTKTTTSTTTTQPAPTATYLDIKEMGIKIKLSDDIKDAVYSFSGSGPATPAAYISSTSLINKAGYCDQKTTPGPLGTITEKKSLGSLTVNNTTVFQVGTNYFVYTSPQAPCTQNSTDQSMEMAQVASFKQALTTLQSDQ